MCFFCDGGTPDEYARIVASDIDTYGRHVVAVESSDLRPGWLYTIGLSERFGHPELVVTAPCCIPCAHATLGGIANQVARGARYSVGDEAVSDDGPGRARFGAVHPRQWKTNLFAAWLEYYEDKPWAPTPRAALQVITQDRRGRWQDDVARRRWRFERLDRAPHLAGQRR